MAWLNLSVVEYKRDFEILNLLQENPCKHPVVILKGVSFADLQAVVTFMYNGQVNVSQERLNSFLQTAELLQIKGLTDMNDQEENTAKVSC